jgi:hypothetical protein
VNRTDTGQEPVPLWLSPTQCYWNNCIWLYQKTVDFCKNCVWNDLREDYYEKWARSHGRVSWDAELSGNSCIYEGVPKSFRTGFLERELQMGHLSASRCSCIVVLWVSLVSFANITLCVASQRVFVVISLSTQSGKILDTASYNAIILFHQG